MARTTKRKFCPNCEGLEGRQLLSVAGDPAAINVTVGSTVHENVFVRGSDGSLRLDYWDE
jgi:hypothetical protein